MHRFFIAPEKLGGQAAYLDEDESRHMTQVMRLKPGDTIVVFDGQGHEYQACYESLQGRLCQVHIIDLIRREARPSIRLALAQGIPKGDKMDTIIQKAVEIGVDSIYPVIGKRSVVQLNQEKRARKRQRWELIAREACKQCRRSWLPNILEPLSLTELLNAMAYNPGIVLYEKETETGLREILQTGSWLMPREETLYLLIGPEGGWDDDEITIMRQHNLHTASLGPRILRTETAGLVAASLVLYEYGALGTLRTR